MGSNPQLGRRSLIYALLALIVCGIIVGLVRWRPMQRVGGAPRRLIRGAPVLRYLRVAGIHPDSVRGKYGALIYLGSEVAAQADYLTDALDSLRKKETDVFLIVPDPTEVSEIQSQGVTVLQDQKGKSRKLLGLTSDTGAYIIFDTESLWCRAARRRAGLQLLRSELLHLSGQIRTEGQGGTLTASDRSTPGYTSWLDSLSLDDIIARASQRQIYLDRLPKRGLKFLYEVGGKEFPRQGELVLAEPWDVAADNRGRVFVCDGNMGGIAVLDSTGTFLRWLAEQGEGPGELLHPSRVVAYGDRLFVAETCCKLHEFDSELRWLRSAYWPAEVGPPVPFSVLRGVVLVELLPFPPDRINLIHFFRWNGEDLRAVGSFFPYALPRRKYSQMYNAILSRNALCMETDGSRYVALYRNSEVHFFLIDVAQKVARKYALVGKDVHTRPRPYAPPYAGRMVVEDFAFDGRGNLFVLVKDYGLVAIELGTGKPWSIYYRPDLPNRDSRLAMYAFVAIRGNRVYLVSPYLARLDICVVER